MTGINQAKLLTDIVDRNQVQKQSCNQSLAMTSARSATGALSFGFSTEALKAALLSLGRIALTRLSVKNDFHEIL